MTFPPSCYSIGLLIQLIRKKKKLKKRKRSRRQAAAAAGPSATTNLQLCRSAPATHRKKKGGGALPCFLACYYSLAIVEDGDANLDGEAGGPVEAVPGGVGGGAGVSLERDVWSHGRGGRAWLWG